MATEGPLTDETRGYLSEDSKRRFTLVAGILGAVFFVAQFLLPMLAAFLVMMPMVFEQEMATSDVEHAALWQEELWLIGQRCKYRPGGHDSCQAGQLDGLTFAGWRARNRSAGFAFLIMAVAAALIAPELVECLYILARAAPLHPGRSWLLVSARW